MQNIDPQQRIAFITGGAMGIGATTCRTLARAGMRVIVADRDTGAAEKTATDLVAEGYAAHAHHIDVGDPESVTSAIIQA